MKFAKKAIKFKKVKVTGIWTASAVEKSQHATAEYPKDGRRHPALALVAIELAIFRDSLQVDSPCPVEQFHFLALRRTKWPTVPPWSLTGP